jgi:hypothetical protein
MLDKEGKNIDAVTIGIPDFMHAAAAFAGVQMCYVLRKAADAHAVGG